MTRYIEIDLSRNQIDLSSAEVVVIARSTDADEVLATRMLDSGSVVLQVPASAPFSISIERDEEVLFTTGRAIVPNPGDDETQVEILIAGLTGRRSRTGHLVDRSQLDGLGAMVGRRLPPDHPLRDRVSRIIECPLPPIDAMRTLLTDSAGALRADRSSIRRLDRMLDLELPDFATDDRPTALSDLRSFFVDRQGSPRRSSVSDLIDRRDLAMSALAAGLTARDERHAVDRILGILAGVAGYGVLAPLARIVEDPRATAAELGRELVRLDNLCNPEAPGLPEIPIKKPRWVPPDPEDIDEFAGCMVEAAQQIIELRSQTYTITSLEPDESACVGHVLTIRGSGFGNVGRVAFPTSGAGSIVVDASSWSPTEIVVEVPVGATCGRLLLEVSAGRVDVCGDTMEVFRHHSGGFDDLPWFEGGEPTVDVVVVPSDVVTPGGEVSFRVSACPSRSSIDIDAERVVRSLGGGPRTSGPWSVPHYRETTRLEVSADAWSDCGTVFTTEHYWVHRRSKIQATSLEVTQATQFHRAAEHIPNAATWQADQAIPLVAHKQTVARLYVGLEPEDPVADFDYVTAGITGTLTGRRNGNHLGTISPMADAVATDDRTVPGQRGSIERSLNFVLPPSWTTPGAPLKLIGRVTASTPALDSVDPSSSEVRIEDVEFIEVPRPTLVFVRVRHQPPTGTASGPPSLTECVMTAARMAPWLPIDQFDIAATQPSDATLVSNVELDLPAAPGSTTPKGWSDLFDQLWDVADDYALPPNSFFVAALASDADTAFVGGVGDYWYRQLAPGDRQTYAKDSGGIVFKVGDVITGVHEICHAVGLTPHSGDSTSGYPNYGQGSATSIGEFGVNVQELTLGSDPVKSPTNTNDVHSPSGGNWISPFTYTAVLKKLATTDPLSGSVAGGAGPVLDLDTAVERLHISGWWRDGSVDLFPLVHFPGQPAEGGSGSDAGLRARLLDREGENWPKPRSGSLGVNGSPAACRWLPMLGRWRSSTAMGRRFRSSIGPKVSL